MYYWNYCLNVSDPKVRKLSLLSEWFPSDCDSLLFPFHRTRKKKFSSVLIQSQEQLCWANQSQLLSCGQCGCQLNETEDLWQCYEESYSISCQTLRVTAYQGNFFPWIWDCKAPFLQETLASAKVHVSPYFLFIFCGCCLFLCLYLSCIFDHSFHLLKKKSSVSFGQTLAKFFCFTSFSRHVDLAIAKVKFSREKNMNDNILKRGQSKFKHVIRSNL